jgi:2-polyprenyl-6-hydroxyphenyl methylase/3-demethylubiquinone-9 3-methyltransferase
MHSVGFVGALIQLHRAFSGASPSDRFHVLGRFLSCPFLRVVRRLPPTARLLDLGSGHGILAQLVAATPQATFVLAVEPDVRKLWAGRPTSRLVRIGAFSDAVAASGSFDAVTICDVLCRVPVAGWDPILATAHQALKPGGKLLLKEIDPANRLKGLWNRAQEKFLADGLGMTLGEAFSYETKEQMTARLEALGFTQVQTRYLGTLYPHAHLLYEAVKRDPLQATK